MCAKKFKLECPYENQYILRMPLMVNGVDVYIPNELKWIQDIIESSINLLNRIHNEYSDEVANELERRFINSIRSGDPRKFKRSISKIIEGKNDDDS